MIYSKNKNYTLYKGQMQDVLDKLQQNSIDSIVADPPYELNFMGKGWDNQGIAFQPDTWKHCYRVLKDGGYLLAFGGSRTFHRIACAIEDAGFEIRDTIMWLYGSGFPKSMNLGLKMDKKQGFPDRGHRIAVANRHHPDGTFEPNGEVLPPYEAKTELGKQWNGWGTCLKPAYEPIIVARKPFKGSLVDNILENGVGGINIDECRVDYNGEIPNIGGRPKHTRGEGYGFKALGEKCEANIQGRFPANVILTYDDTDFDEVCGGFPSSDLPNGSLTKKYNCNNEIYSKFPPRNEFNSYQDNGSASRYFYCAKASKKDRDEGLDLFDSLVITDGRTKSIDNAFNRGETLRKNIHPTVKPIELMQYLVRLVSPKGATVLDCFMGSGSTGKAVMFENRERNANYHFIGVEMTEEYLPICQARIDYALNKYKYDLAKQTQELKEKGIQTIFDFMEE